jgi:hypothetical protein
MELQLPLTGVLGTTSQVSVVLSKSLGFAAELEKVEIIPFVVGTGAGASRTINVRKGSATGSVAGTVTATLANQTTIGTVTAGTVTEANAKFGDGDTLTIELPSGGTVFTAGGAHLVLTFRVPLQRAK